MDVAGAIQESSLPSVFPAFPDRAEFDIFASMTPAREVGGDFYNFFLVDHDRLALVIGDVSGKGVPAALFMMGVNLLIREHMQHGGTPAEVLTYVNDRICDSNTVDMFVTLWLGVLDIPTGRIVFANGGHEDAAVYRRGEAFSLFKTRHGLAVGAMPGIKYRDWELQLNRGDKLFLYTDGVPEATDSDNRMFMLDRTLETLNRYRDRAPKEILEGVHAQVNAFVGDAPQFDDLTMLCVELRESAEKQA